MSDEPSNYPDGGMHMAALAVMLIIVLIIAAIVFAFGREWALPAAIFCMVLIVLSCGKRNG